MSSHPAHSSKQISSFIRDAWSLPILIIFSLLLACFVERSVFGDAFAINDDVRNQAYWMARIADPSLYPQDYIASYFTQPSLISPLVWGLYALAAHWVEPLRFSQFLPLPLMMLSTFFLFQYGAQRAGKHYAFWVSFLFNLFIWTIRNVAGGLPRAFSYPLLFFFLWQFSKKNAWGVSLALCLASAIYPPVMLLAFGLLVVEFWVAKKKKSVPGDDSKPAFNRKVLIPGVIAAFAVSMARYVFQPPHVFGALTNWVSAFSIVELYPGGRIPLFLFPPMPKGLHWLEPLLQMIPHLYITLPAIALMGMLFLHRKYLQPHWGKLYIPSEIWKLLGISVVFYLLAWGALFYLYVPERYLQFTLPLALVFVLGGFFAQWAQTVNGSALPTGRKKLAQMGLLILPLVLLMGFWQPDVIHPSPDSAQLTRFLQTTPKAAMIAANPGLSSNIPALARRSVLMSHEAYIPFHQAYFKEMKTRLKDWLLAYYATEPAPLSAFLSRYRIDYLVLDTNDYESFRLDNFPKNYYNAFPATFFQKLRLKKKSQGSVKNGYLLYRIAQKHAVFRNETYLVVPVAAIQAALNTSSRKTSL